jgi:hypothetical protein
VPLVVPLVGAVVRTVRASAAAAAAPLDVYAPRCARVVHGDPTPTPTPIPIPIPIPSVLFVQAPIPIINAPCALRTRSVRSPHAPTPIPIPTVHAAASNARRAPSALQCAPIVKCSTPSQARPTHSVRGDAVAVPLPHGPTTVPPCNNGPPLTRGPPSNRAPPFTTTHPFRCITAPPFNGPPSIIVHTCTRRARTTSSPSHPHAPARTHIAPTLPPSALSHPHTTQCASRTT